MRYRPKLIMATGGVGFLLCGLMMALFAWAETPEKVQAIQEQIDTLTAEAIELRARIMGAELPHSQWPDREAADAIYADLWRDFARFHAVVDELESLYDELGAARTAAADALDAAEAAAETAASMDDLEIPEIPAELGDALDELGGLQEQVEAMRAAAGPPLEAPVYIPDVSKIMTCTGESGGAVEIAYRFGRVLNQTVANPQLYGFVHCDIVWFETERYDELRYNMTYGVPEIECPACGGLRNVSNNQQWIPGTHPRLDLLILRQDVNTTETAPRTAPRNATMPDWITSSVAGCELVGDNHYCGDGAGGRPWGWELINGSVVFDTDRDVDAQNNTDGIMFLPRNATQINATSAGVNATDSAETGPKYTPYDELPFDITLVPNAEQCKERLGSWRVGDTYYGMRADGPDDLYVWHFHNNTAWLVEGFCR